MTIERAEHIGSNSNAERARICVIGLGAFGSPVVDNLARHEVGLKGEWYLFDGDKVEKRNRLSVYTSADYGMNKVGALARHMIQIDHGYLQNVKANAAFLKKEDVPGLIELARNLDLLCLFADDNELMDEVAEACYEVCPIIRGVFSRYCDYAEIGYSVPNQTVRLSKTFGRRARARIRRPEATGYRTNIVGAMTADICHNLLNQGEGKEFFIPVFRNAPLYVVGFRKSWIFEHIPEEQLITVLLVEVE